MPNCAAAACKALAGRRTSPDDAWLAGLLHDIGYWILIQECPQELSEAIELVARTVLATVRSANGRLTGATHAEIGAYLLGLWGLPYPIVEAVALAPHTRRASPHGYDLDGRAAVSHAHCSCPRCTRLFDSRAGRSPEVDAAYLASLNAPFDWQEAEQRVQREHRPRTS